MGKLFDEKLDKNLENVSLNDIESYYPTPDFFHVRMHGLSLRGIDSVVLVTKNN